MKNKDVSIFLITKYDEYIYFPEYNKNMDDDVIFIYLTNDELNSDCNEINNSICIYKKWKTLINESAKQFPKRFIGINQQDKLQYKQNFKETSWQHYEIIDQDDDFYDFDEVEIIDIPNNDEYKCIEDDEQYIDRYIEGYMSCMNIKRNIVSELNGIPIKEFIPAIMLACDITFKFGNYMVKGYLPAVGQWIYINQNRREINIALDLIKGDKFLSSNWWSSTECSYNETWSTDELDKPYMENKIAMMKVFPLFIW